MDPIHSLPSPLGYPSHFTPSLRFHCLRSGIPPTVFHDLALAIEEERDKEKEEEDQEEGLASSILDASLPPHVTFPPTTLLSAYTSVRSSFPKSSEGIESENNESEKRQSSLRDHGTLAGTTTTSSSTSSLPSPLTPLSRRQGSVLARYVRLHSHAVPLLLSLGAMLIGEWIKSIVPVTETRKCRWAPPASAGADKAGEVNGFPTASSSSPSLTSFSSKEHEQDECISRLLSFFSSLSKGDLSRGERWEKEMTATSSWCSKWMRKNAIIFSSSSSRRSRKTNLHHRQASTLSKIAQSGSHHPPPAPPGSRPPSITAASVQSANIVGTNKTAEKESAREKKVSGFGNCSTLKRDLLRAVLFEHVLLHILEETALELIREKNTSNTGMGMAPLSLTTTTSSRSSTSSNTNDGILLKGIFETDLLERLPPLLLMWFSVSYMLQLPLLYVSPVRWSLPTSFSVDSNALVSSCLSSPLASSSSSPSYSSVLSAGYLLFAFSPLYLARLRGTVELPRNCFPSADAFSSSFATTASSCKLSEECTPSCLQVPLSYFFAPMDAASLAPIMALHPQPGERFMDVCCAPGMKLQAIAEKLLGNPTAPVPVISSTCPSSSLPRCPHQQQQQQQCELEEEHSFLDLAQEGGPKGFVVGVDLDLHRLFLTRSLLDQRQGTTWSSKQGSITTPALLLSPSCSTKPFSKSAPPRFFPSFSLPLSFPPDLPIALFYGDGTSFSFWDAIQTIQYPLSVVQSFKNPHDDLFFSPPYGNTVIPLTVSRSAGLTAKEAQQLKRKSKLLSAQRKSAPPHLERNISNAVGTTTESRGRASTCLTILPVYVPAAVRQVFSSFLCNRSIKESPSHPARPSSEQQGGGREENSNDDLFPLVPQRKRGRNENQGQKDKTFRCDCFPFFPSPSLLPFDGVLVDAECTHDGSLAHVDTAAAPTKTTTTRDANHEPTANAGDETLLHDNKKNPSPYFPSRNHHYDRSTDNNETGKACLSLPLNNDYRMERWHIPTLLHSSHCILSPPRFSVCPTRTCAKTTTITMTGTKSCQNTHHDTDTTTGLSRWSDASSLIPSSPPVGDRNRGMHSIRNHHHHRSQERKGGKEEEREIEAPRVKPTSTGVDRSSWLSPPSPLMSSAASSPLYMHCPKCFWSPVSNEKNLFYTWLREDELLQLQLALLLNSYRQLRGGGRMIYSTCSMSYLQNEYIIHCFLRLVNRYAKENSGCDADELDKRTEKDPVHSSFSVCQMKKYTARVLPTFPLDLFSENVHPKEEDWSEKGNTAWSEQGLTNVDAAHQTKTNAQGIENVSAVHASSSFSPAAAAVTALPSSASIMVLLRLLVVFQDCLLTLPLPSISHSSANHSFSLSPTPDRMALPLSPPHQAQSQNHYSHPSGSSYTVSKEERHEGTDVFLQPPLPAWRRASSSFVNSRLASYEDFCDVLAFSQDDYGIIRNGNMKLQTLALADDEDEEERVLYAPEDCIPCSDKLSKTSVTATTSDSNINMKNVRSMRTNRWVVQKCTDIIQTKCDHEDEGRDGRDGVGKMREKRQKCGDCTSNRSTTSNGNSSSNLIAHEHIQMGSRLWPLHLKSSFQFVAKIVKEENIIM